MDLYHKHSKEIFSLLGGLIKDSTIKSKINDSLINNISSLCKLVSTRSEILMFDRQIYKMSDLRSLSKEDIKKTRSNVKNDLETEIVSDLEIGKIDLEYNENKANYLNESSFLTLKKEENNEIRETINLDDERKLKKSMLNESQFKCLNEQLEISIICKRKPENISLNSSIFPSFIRGPSKTTNKENIKDENKLSIDRNSSTKNSSDHDSNRISLDLKVIKGSINTELSDKDIQMITKEMSGEFIIELNKKYQNLKINTSFSKDNIRFVNNFKQFLLEVGVSEKTLYEKMIRMVILNNNQISLKDLYMLCHKILNQEYNYNLLKYKLLLNIITRKNPMFFDDNEIESFIILMKSVSNFFNKSKVFNVEVHSKIKKNLKNKYRELFPKSVMTEFKKLSFVLEQILINK